MTWIFKHSLRVVCHEFDHHLPERPCVSHCRGRDFPGADQGQDQDRAATSGSRLPTINSDFRPEAKARGESDRDQPRPRRIRLTRGHVAACSRQFLTWIPFFFTHSAGKIVELTGVRTPVLPVYISIIIRLINSINNSGVNVSGWGGLRGARPPCTPHHTCCNRQGRRASRRYGYKNPLRMCFRKFLFLFLFGT